MTSELLEKRLERLADDGPDARRVIENVLGRKPARRAPAWPRFAWSVVAALVLVAMVAYFVPAAGTVVARVPFAGDALGARARVTVVGASATSSGYTLTLVAAYADSTRTELRLHSSPAVAFIGLSSAITDQFGRSYHSVNGRSNALTGDLTEEFEALAWPDANTGARITLTVTELDLDGHAPPTAIHGKWTVSAILGVDEGVSVALPPPGTVGAAHFRFTSMSYTPATIAVDVDMTGATSQSTGQLYQEDPSNPKGEPVLGIEVLDAFGTRITMSIEIDDGFFGVSHVHVLAGRDDTGGGRYTIRVTYRGQHFDRTLVVT
ncbi:MAG TPA: hypothetical protein VLR46_14660 [Candidatus Dormibacteraeota bacterium]|nr:hypothetical protein [Candidatus Dormibacteraeota bacterium]